MQNTANRRTLKPEELRLFVHASDLGNEHPLLHIVRVTVKGNLIAACQTSAEYLEQGNGYYLLPFLSFVYKNVPLCGFCQIAVERDLDSLLD